jgi:hypothetical protein
MRNAEIDEAGAASELEGDAKDELSQEERRGDLRRNYRRLENPRAPEGRYHG